MYNEIILCLLKSVLKGTDLSQQKTILPFCPSSYLRPGVWMWEGELKEPSGIMRFWVIKLLIFPALPNSRCHEYERKSISIKTLILHFWCVKPNLILIDIHPMRISYKKTLFKEKLHIKKLCQIYCFTQIFFFYIKQAKTNSLRSTSLSIKLVNWGENSRTICRVKISQDRRGRANLCECKEALNFKTDDYFYTAAT